QSGIKSGNAGYSFGSLNTNGGANLGSTQTAGALAVTFDGTSTGPTSTRTVSSTNKAGLDSANATYSLTNDTTAPSSGSVSVPAYSSSLGAITTTTGAYSDAGSGIASNVITRSGAQSPSSPGVCPGSGYSGATTVTSPDTVPTDGKCYLYTLTGTDNVGNAASVSSSPILVDTTAPSAPGLAYSAFTATSATGDSLYYRPGTSGDFTVTASSSDAEPGVGYGVPTRTAGWAASGSGASRA